MITLNKRKDKKICEYVYRLTTLTGHFKGKSYLQQTIIVDPRKKHYSDFDVKFMLVFKNCQNIQTILRKVNLGKIGPVFAKFLQSKSEVNTQ